MQRILLVSNRLPVTLERRKGAIEYNYSVGGLATGLKAIYKSYKSLWIGWNGIPVENLSTVEQKQIAKKLREKYDCYSTLLSRRDVRLFYQGFCNNTLWPLFHYFPNHTIYEKTYWQAYKRVNELFCQSVLKIAEPDDIIWVHDYQLLPLPQLIRQQMPEVRIGFFLHIPFPSSEMFRLLPWRRTILQGMLGADLIGFHTYDYVRHFLSSVRSLLGYEHASGLIYPDNRVVKVDAFPMGIDYERYHNAVNSPATQKEIRSLRNKLHDRKIIVSIDRLDYTKGLLQRLEAFDLFLEEHPQYREKVTLIVVAVPSRTNVRQYQELKQQVDERVGRINGRHGAIGWTPVWYLYRSLPFEMLTALYYIADIALVTPLRDGMNLIAKEFVATKTDGKGVLILSEMAGAAAELGEAVIVNPNNIDRVKEGIQQALDMPEEEVASRLKTMQQRLKRYDVRRWANDFMEGMVHIRVVQKRMDAKSLTKHLRSRMIHEYNNARKRLLLLDYDGTMIPFANTPEQAVPDKRLLSILEALAHDPRNDVVIISGRDRNTLETFFGRLNIGFVAMHGGWIKKKSQKWELTERLNDDWKDIFRQILELYVDRTPGALLEEKEFSLVFHYRRSDPDLAQLRVRELLETLRDMTEKIEVEVFEGNKVIEVKNAGIDKGRASLHWISGNAYDFILAVGDDWTDEDTFAVVPDFAYSIKVGFGLSKARYNLNSVDKVRQLLQELTGG